VDELLAATVNLKGNCATRSAREKDLADFSDKKNETKKFIERVHMNKNIEPKKLIKM
jgi:hypothetical protein